MVRRAAVSGKATHRGGRYIRADTYVNKCCRTIQVIRATAAVPPRSRLQSAAPPRRRRPRADGHPRGPRPLGVGAASPAQCGRQTRAAEPSWGGGGNPHPGGVSATKCPPHDGGAPPSRSHAMPRPARGRRHPFPLLLPLPVTSHPLCCCPPFPTRPCFPTALVLSALPLPPVSPARPLAGAGCPRCIAWDAPVGARALSPGKAGSSCYLIDTLPPSLTPPPPLPLRASAS